MTTRPHNAPTPGRGFAFLGSVVRFIDTHPSYLMLFLVIGLINAQTFWGDPATLSTITTYKQLLEQKPATVYRTMWTLHTIAMLAAVALNTYEWRRIGLYICVAVFAWYGYELWQTRLPSPGWKLNAAYSAVAAFEIWNASDRRQNRRRRRKDD